METEEAVDGRGGYGHLAAKIGDGGEIAVSLGEIVIGAEAVFNQKLEEALHVAPLAQVGENLLPRVGLGD